MLELDLSCFIFNEYQNKEFSLYNLVIYYSFIQTFKGEYDYGYQFFSKLNKDVAPYREYKRALKYKNIIKDFEKNPEYQRPVVVNRNYSIWAEDDKLAMGIYFGVKKIPVTFTKKPQKIVYNDSWVIDNYTPEESIELQKQKTLFLNVAKALVS